MKKIAGFDALRALSVTLVILSHIGVIGAVSSPWLKAFFTVFNAFTGVTFFFVLSGFLITTLLIKEHRSAGRIDIKNFFMRRALRILPLYYLSIGIAYLFGVFGVQKIPDAAIIHGLTYTYNFVPVQFNVGFLSHLWSLAVEEQFYLIWPFLFLLLVAKPWRLVLICIVATATCYSVAISFDWHSEIHKLYYVGRWFIPAAYPIFIGCMFALMLQYSTSAKRILGTWYCLTVATLFLSAPLVFHNALNSLNQQYFVAFGVALLICWISQNQHQRAVQLLDWGPIGYLGTISYGLYMWQGIFTGNGNIDSHNWPPPMGWGVLLTFVAAPLSYHSFEKPLLKLKSKFAREAAQKSLAGSQMISKL